MSPDRAQLRKVMAVGGSSDAVRASAVPVTSQQIQLYPVEIPAFHDIISKGGLTHFYCDPASPSTGTLTIQISTQIGKGVFKTAHPGYLTLTHLAKAGLGRKPSEYVVVKHIYHPKGKSSNGVARYSAADEHMKTIEEANVRKCMPEVAARANEAQD
ncbi:hypothetical protein FB45DRAFT_1084732 [Roridomyces roridus]|uniref:Uncharacterized protein n=1 Tax=Roridomyces roridus TaxID=1738132 RepID=A0AAD7BNU5_9AGAR|nr:hypothetical protein FB45DRAFT_1084732 [Roridomyces roridus]